MISKKAIEELKQMYKEDFGEELSDPAAFELGNNLLNLFRIIHRPIRKNYYGQPTKKDIQ